VIRRIRARVREHASFLLDRWQYANSRLPPLVFLGDSHVTYFVHAAKRGQFGARRHGARAVAGATAVGLRNPQAKTNALQIFSDYLRKWPPESVVIVHLGEVDCGFVIWYRNQKYRDGIERQLDDSIAAYFSFVDDAIARGYRNVVITGATVPTIQDDQDWGEVAHARREVTASLAQRTALTFRYNARLKEQAEARGLPFVDISSEIVDAETGVVKPAFRNANPLDHHLDRERAAERWADRLNAVLRRPS
jgi:hypothetical protein